VETGPVRVPGRTGSTGDRPNLPTVPWTPSYGLSGFSNPWGSHAGQGGQTATSLPCHGGQPARALAGGTQIPSGPTRQALIWAPSNVNGRIAVDSRFGNWIPASSGRPLSSSPPFRGVPFTLPAPRVSSSPRRTSPAATGQHHGARR
jgi:hypothetical protein